jgi:hypothetical protein
MCTHSNGCLGPFHQAMVYGPNLFICVFSCCNIYFRLLNSDPLTSIKYEKEFVYSKHSIVGLPLPPRRFS